MQITFLSALFLTAVGILLASYGEVLHHAAKSEGADGVFVRYASLQFCGAALSAIFWVC